LFNIMAFALGREKDAVPGFANNTPHKALVSGRAADGGRLKTLATDAVGTARDMAREARTAAVERADATAAWVGTTVKERPFHVLGIAVAVGAIIGLLIARRQDR